MTATLLADKLNLHPSIRNRDSGLTFVRRAKKTNKALARNQVLSLFSKRNWPGPLSILTMPSISWDFERALLERREHGKDRRPRCTYITSIERSPFVFQAAIPSMPGADSRLSCAMQLPPYAKSGVKSYTIGRFYQCELSDLAEWYSGEPHAFDAVWVDLTGPLSVENMHTLHTLWQSVRSYLVITSLRARWTSDFSAALSDAGSIAALLMDDLTGSVAVCDYEYMDSSPMSQVTLRRIIHA